MTDASADAAPIIQTAGLGRTYGRFVVLDELDLTVNRGDVLGIIGPNGAGKSTLLGLLGGSVRPTHGRITYRGEDITRRTAYWRAKNGIATSYQVPRPFLGMTTLENVLVAARYAAGLSGKDANRAAVEALERTELIGRGDAQAGELRLLDRKRLEVARALAANPQLILLDEIAGGLTEHEVPALVELVRAVSAEGVTIVWIEHVVHALMQAATRMLCLTYGKVLAEGEPRAVLDSPEVRSVYLGIEPDAPEIEGEATDA